MYDVRGHKSVHLANDALRRLFRDIVKDQYLDVRTATETGTSGADGGEDEPRYPHVEGSHFSGTRLSPREFRPLFPRRPAVQRSNWARQGQRRHTQREDEVAARVRSAVAEEPQQRQASEYGSSIRLSPGMDGCSRSSHNVWGTSVSLQEGSPASEKQEGGAPAARTADYDTIASQILVANRVALTPEAIEELADQVSKLPAAEALAVVTQLCNEMRVRHSFFNRLQRISIEHSAQALRRSICRSSCKWTSAFCATIIDRESQSGSSTPSSARSQQENGRRVVFPWVLGARRNALIISMPTHTQIQSSSFLQVQAMLRVANIRVSRSSTHVGTQCDIPTADFLASQMNTRSASIRGVLSECVSEHDFCDRIRELGCSMMNASMCHVFFSDGTEGGFRTRGSVTEMPGHSGEASQAHHGDASHDITCSMHLSLSDQKHTNFPFLIKTPAQSLQQVLDTGENLLLSDSLDRRSVADLERVVAVLAGSQVSKRFSAIVVPLRDSLGVLCAAWCSPPRNQSRGMAPVPPKILAEHREQVRELSHLICETYPLVTGVHRELRELSREHRQRRSKLSADLLRHDTDVALLQSHETLAATQNVKQLEHSVIAVVRRQLSKMLSRAARLMASLVEVDVEYQRTKPHAGTREEFFNMMQRYDGLQEIMQRVTEGESLIVEAVTKSTGSESFDSLCFCKRFDDVMKSTSRGGPSTVLLVVASAASTAYVPSSPGHAAGSNKRTGPLRLLNRHRLEHLMDMVVDVFQSRLGDFNAEETTLDAIRMQHQKQEKFLEGYMTEVEERTAAVDQSLHSDKGQPDLSEAFEGVMREIRRRMSADHVIVYATRTDIVPERMLRYQQPRMEFNATRFPRRRAFVRAIYDANQGSSCRLAETALLSTTSGDDFCSNLHGELATEKYWFQVERFAPDPFDDNDARKMSFLVRAALRQLSNTQSLLSSRHRWSTMMSQLGMLQHANLVGRNVGDGRGPSWLAVLKKHLSCARHALQTDAAMVFIIDWQSTEALAAPLTRRSWEAATLTLVAGSGNVPSTSLCGPWRDFHELAPRQHAGIPDAHVEDTAIEVAQASPRIWEYQLNRRSSSVASLQSVDGTTDDMSLLAQWFGESIGQATSCALQSYSGSPLGLLCTVNLGKSAQLRRPDVNVVSTAANLMQTLLQNVHLHAEIGATIEVDAAPSAACVDDVPGSTGSEPRAGSVK